MCGRLEVRSSPMGSSGLHFSNSKSLRDGKPLGFGFWRKQCSDVQRFWYLTLGCSSVFFFSEHLNSIEDYIRFGTVCRSWQSVTVDQRRYNFSPKTLPWMMFPFYEKGEVDNNYSGSHEFYSLSEGVHKLYLPEAINCSCSGSPYGWLIIRGNQRMEILNPLSRVSFLLPPISMLEDFVGSDPSYCTNSTHLVILPSSSSTVPLKELFVAFVLFREDGKLAFARPTDRAWTTMKISNTSHKDILLFNNKFYIVDTEGMLWCFDITRRVGIEIALPPKDKEDEPKI
ncbi:hypothetical protein IFM89_019176 [Coptis chinensis]|uniref:KIB1-4 beta-propeller domain-containing protein n=1 Tax=Coptis chinensis TaxID=261450 RepID=A0A835GX11_9MAGN|nr:hypothetical protein IFM89_019176 [Coptis chinensis]